MEIKDILEAITTLEKNNGELEKEKESLINRITNYKKEMAEMKNQIKELQTIVNEKTVDNDRVEELIKRNNTLSDLVDTYNNSIKKAVAHFERNRNEIQYDQAVDNLEMLEQLN